MSMARRYLPHPVTSTLLTAVWLLLNHSIAPGHVLLGIVLGVSIPLFTRRFFPERVYLGRVTALVKFVTIVLFDIVIANFAVGRLTVGPIAKLRPRFIRVPVSMTDDFALTALMSTIALTPGTVSANLSADRTHIIVHALDVDDENALIATIKGRYETLIKEIFKC